MLVLAGFEGADPGKPQILRVSRAGLEGQLGWLDPDQAIRIASKQGREGPVGELSRGRYAR